MLIKSALIGLALTCLAACNPERNKLSEAAESSAVAVKTIPSTPLQTAAMETKTMQTRTLQLWSRSCALCHVDGNGGAPRVGNVAEWTPRLAQGPQVLLQHTLQGLGDMPPLGYCMACEEADFAAMITLMTQGIAAPEVAEES